MLRITSQVHVRYYLNTYPNLITKWHHKSWIEVSIIWCITVSLQNWIQMIIFYMWAHKWHHIHCRSQTMSKQFTDNSNVYYICVEHLQVIFDKTLQKSSSFSILTSREVVYRATAPCPLVDTTCWNWSLWLVLGTLIGRIIRCDSISLTYL